MKCLKCKENLVDTREWKFEVKKLSKKIKTLNVSTLLYCKDCKTFWAYVKLLGTGDFKKIKQTCKQSILSQGFVGLFEN